MWKEKVEVEAAEEVLGAAAAAAGEQVQEEQQAGEDHSYTRSLQYRLLGQRFHPKSVHRYQGSPEERDGLGRHHFLTNLLIYSAYCILV